MTEHQAASISKPSCNMVEEPKDLTLKTAVNKKLRPIPPPLNLSQSSTSDVPSPASANLASPKNSFAQKSLPFRKRAHSTSDSPPQSQAQPPQVKLQNVLTPSWTIPASFQTLFESTPSPMDFRLQDVVPYPNFDQRLALSTSVLLSPAPSSVGSSREELLLESVRVPSLSHYYPQQIFPVWHCFISGTKIKLPAKAGESNLNNDDWRLVDDLPHSKLRPDWPGKLTVEQIFIIKNDWKKVEDGWKKVEEGSTFDFRIKFSCPDGELEALCLGSQMFFTTDNIWCCLSVDRLRGNSRLLQVGDICLPPSMIQPAQLLLSSLDVSERLYFPFVPASPDICDRMQRFSFPNCADEPLPMLSPPTTPTRGTQAVPDKAKRPMNAFMLFAKRYRLELIQSNPSKDNRAISVLLGEAWRQLPQAEKDVYINEARSLAHHQKLLHPDCWKRKRSHSTS
ncbi:HMG box-containing protein 1 [Bemisia tabaci]|uniref:HMG box-containing protein 1 n=1 Tax=Bemisia tabaci TaxID=7038 RepID=UPI0008F99B15|nr:PREDICTED: HMG box-containing protein 1-like [Bemisia tabaci]XP_018903886.1 PREDICTED: HMG box-containing protein 1-like [Bemisia tabaci]